VSKVQYREEQAHARICAELQESLNNHLTGFYIRHGCIKLFLEQAARTRLWMANASTAAEGSNLCSACIAGFCIVPSLCWHQNLHNCTTKPTGKRSAGSKPNNNNNKLVALRPWLSAVQPNCRSSNCSPSGLEKEVKVTALQKDGYLAFSLLDGLKCS